MDMLVLSRRRTRALSSTMTSPSWSSKSAGTRCVWESKLPRKCRSIAARSTTRSGATKRRRKRPGRHPSRTLNGEATGSKSDRAGPRCPPLRFDVTAFSGFASVRYAHSLARRVPADMHFSDASRTADRIPLRRSLDGCRPCLVYTGARLLVPYCPRIRPRRLARSRTPAFHADNTGSNPVGVTFCRCREPPGSCRPAGLRVERSPY